MKKYFKILIKYENGEIGSHVQAVVSGYCDESSAMTAYKNYRLYHEPLHGKLVAREMVGAELKKYQLKLYLN